MYWVWIPRGFCTNHLYANGKNSTSTSSHQGLALSINRHFTCISQWRNRCTSLYGTIWRLHAGRLKKDHLSLNKSLYGSKQGGWQWNKQLHEGLMNLGFTRNYSNASLYINAHKDVQIIMWVFVDDMTLASKLKAALDNFMIELGKHFKLWDLRPTTKLLGIKIDCDCSCWSILLSQHHTPSKSFKILGWGTANLSQPQWSWDFSCQMIYQRRMDSYEDHTISHSLGVHNVPHNNYSPLHTICGQCTC